MNFVIEALAVLSSAKLWMRVSGMHKRNVNIRKSSHTLYWNYNCDKTVRFKNSTNEIIYLFGTIRIILSFQATGTAGRCCSSACFSCELLMLVIAWISYYSWSTIFCISDSSDNSFEVSYYIYIYVYRTYISYICRHTHHARERVRVLYSNKITL